MSTRTSHPTERLVTGLVCAVLTEAPKRSDLDDSDEETEIHKMQMPALEMSQRPNFYFSLSRRRHRRAVLMPGCMGAPKATQRATRRRARPGPLRLLRSSESSDPSFQRLTRADEKAHGLSLKKAGGPEAHVTCLIRRLARIGLHVLSSSTALRGKVPSAAWWQEPMSASHAR